MILWLLFAGACGHDQSWHDEGRCDASSMVQMKAGATQAIDCDGWVLADPDASCSDACGADLCTAESIDKMFITRGPELKRLVKVCFGVVTLTDGFVAEDNFPYHPSVFYQRIYAEPGDLSQPTQKGLFEPTEILEPLTSTTCDAKRANPANNYGRRICFCSSSGPVTGDRHITTLRGDHYTLLKQGTFLAWSFRKTSFNSGIQPVEWQLLASYSGARFTTAGLLLIDHTHSVMELTAKDCQWRGRQSGGEWHNATVGVDGEDRPAYVEVIALNRTIKGHLHIESVMKLKMKEEDQTNSVAELVTHCKPGERLDFKVRMYDQDDLDHVGGELGAPKHRAEKQVSFLSSKHINMKTDSEFEVPMAWLTLGGSEEADSYLKTRMQAGAEVGVSLLQSCSEAERICAKHLVDLEESEAFADCVFDVCNGGNEADAEAAAEMLAE